MAFKVLILARKRSDLEWEEFVDAYESHCDWMQERIAAEVLAPLIDYRRNYVMPEHRLQNPPGLPLDFDVIAEAWFADEAGLDSNNRAASDEAFLDETLIELKQYLEVESIRYVPVLEKQKRGEPPVFHTGPWSA